MKIKLSSSLCLCCRNIEKIKTIGATFMAASGLNPFIRGENQFKYQHIQELMEFAFRYVDSCQQLSSRMYNSCLSRGLHCHYF